MEIKECVIKSALYPFALQVQGSEEDIECFKSLIDDSSDMAGYCISFSGNRDFDSMDPTEYKLDGKTIFEYRKENRALAARIRELDRSHDRLVDANRVLAVNLARALSAKPDYAELHAFIADLEKSVMDISEAANRAIEAVNGYETK